jgi:hypothetical protein
LAGVSLSPSLQTSWYSFRMTDKLGALAADSEFFKALLAANVEALDKFLADNFILVDVARGAETTKPALLEVIGSGQVKFETIAPTDQRVRLYQATAVINGRTQMSGRLGETPFAMNSRYTHVFVELEGRLRLVAAQDTQIVTE